MISARALKIMSRRICLFVCVVTLFDAPAFAMTLEDIAAERQVDWSTAGVPGGIPTIEENIVDVKALGAAGDGVTDDSTVIQAAIDAAADPAVIFLPEGTYRIEAALELKTGVVLRGDGSDATHLDCYSNNGCAEINGRTSGGFQPIVSGLAKGSVAVEVADASEFRVGQGAEIRQEDIDAVDPTGEWGSNPGWVPTHVVGQMVRIMAIDGNQLTIAPPLHLTFDATKHPEMMPVSFVERVGIEDLSIRRLDTGNISNNINIRRAADCWLRRIESDQTQQYHFSISQSLNLEIRSCYIHDAYHKGGGGRGYGTSLERYVTSVLVEDNIFSDLRHAMIIQLGANGCVFGYNYARRNYSDDGWDKTYISVHGHYPYMNLFEGNVVGMVGLADYWGASGPGNTLFRNRIVGTDKHEDFGPYRGISVDDYSHRQNLIGNELTGSETRITFDGHDDPAQGTSNDVILHGNNVHGTIQWDAAIGDQVLPASFYRTVKPDFFDQWPWPAMGPDIALNSGTIPAVERFNRQAFVPQPADGGSNDGGGGGDGGGGDDGAGTPPAAPGDTNGSGSGGGGCFISSGSR